MTVYPRATISTRYLPATNSRGSRIVASSQAGRITIPFPYGLHEADGHFEAVKALLKAKGLNWGNKWAMGATKTGYVFTPLAVCNVVNLEDAA